MQNIKKVYGEATKNRQFFFWPHYRMHCFLQHLDIGCVFETKIHNKFKWQNICIFTYKTLCGAAKKKMREYTVGKQCFSIRTKGFNVTTINFLNLPFWSAIATVRKWGSHRRVRITSANTTSWAFSKKVTNYVAYYNRHYFFDKTQYTRERKAHLCAQEKRQSQVSFELETLQYAFSLFEVANHTLLLANIIENKSKISFLKQCSILHQKKSIDIT